MFLPANFAMKDFLLFLLVIASNSHLQHLPNTRKDRGVLPTPSPSLL